MGEQLVGAAVRTHIYRFKSVVSHGYGLWHPETVTIVTSRWKDHHNKYNDDEKVWNIVRIPEM